MGFGRKYDWPPLLPPGRHVMSLKCVKARFVDPYPGQLFRLHLFQKLEEVVQAYLVAGIPCEIMVDGSFLTRKNMNTPGSDLDVTVIIDNDVVQSLTQEQRALVDLTAEGGFANDVDSFAFAKLPRGHPDFGDQHLDPAYSWGEQYGLENSDQWLKGYVVLKLRETNVGLRICS